MPLKQQQVTDNILQLLDVLPPGLRIHLDQEHTLDGLLEIVMDLGRMPEARYIDRCIELGTNVVADEDIGYVVNRVGSFGKDNRAGIERTLHRISAIRNRTGKVIGLTCRVGRAVYGTIDIIQDVIESGKSILMLGRPGRGKTTKLREVARVISDELKKRVVIVDTSNEIAGDGDIPHPAIGRARRMQVIEPSQQHNVMIEAVENHMPEVIVIDEIGTEQEAFAARTIAERGVQLVGTAHGNTLENLLMNPTLSDLIGGIQAVTLSDDEAKRRGTQKTVLERKAPPTFEVIIEIIDVDKVAIHHDVLLVVDQFLRGKQPRPEIRVRNEYGEIEVAQRAEHGIREVREIRAIHDLDEDDFYPMPEPEYAPRTNGRVSREDSFRPASAPNTVKREGMAPKRIFPYGVNRNRLDRAILECHVPATIARDVSEADVIIALKTSYRREPGKMKDGSARNLPTVIVKSNTFAQIANAVRDLFQTGPLEKGYVEEAIEEAEEGIERVRAGSSTIELAPQNGYMRRLQHEVIERNHLVSESIGEEPRRRVRIFPTA